MMRSGLRLMSVRSQAASSAPAVNCVKLCMSFIAVVVGLFVYSVVRTPVLSVEQLRDMGVFILPRPPRGAARPGSLPAVFVLENRVR